MQYAYLTVETVTPPPQGSPLSTVLEKGNSQEQLTRSLTQSISIVVYSNAVGSHEVTLPCILDKEYQPGTALLTSTSYIARPSDSGRTHRIKLSSIGGLPKPIRSRHEDKFRWGYEPFASFNFDYRDSKLLKQLDLAPSGEKPFNMPRRRKRTHDDFLENVGYAQHSQQSSHNVKSGIGASSVESDHYKRQIEWGHDGYGLGSRYRPCGSQSRRSVESEETLAPMSTGANTIPVPSRRASHITHSSADREEPMRGRSHSHSAAIMSTASSTSGARSRVDPRIPHSHSSLPVSTSRDPRQHNQSDSILETPRSPPAQSSRTQPAVFQEMSQDMYEACISAVTIPGKFIRKNATNRKIMPLALLRIKEAEDEQRERREWEVDDSSSGRFHPRAKE